MGLPTLLYQLLTLAALLLLVNAMSLTKRRDIDCRKYVFAPRCRGIAAKRALQDTDSLGEFFNSADMENYLLKEALSARKETGGSQQDMLLSALLGGMSRPSPTQHRHKYPETDRELLMYLLSPYSKGDDFTTD